MSIYSVGFTYIRFDSTTTEHAHILDRRHGFDSQKDHSTKNTFKTHVGTTQTAKGAAGGLKPPTPTLLKPIHKRYFIGEGYSIQNDVRSCRFSYLVF